MDKPDMNGLTIMLMAFTRSQIEYQLKRPLKKSKSGRAAGRTSSGGSSGGRGAGKPLSSGRRWLFRIFALVVIPLLLLSAIEVGLRLAGYGFDPALFKKITIGGEQFYVN